MIMNYHGNAVPKFFILLVLKKVPAIDVDVILRVVVVVYEEMNGALL